jgi:hypothetical protein
MEISWFILALLAVAAYACVGIFIIVGAVQMMRLKSYGWAMTASILALLPCSPAGLLGLAMGIWSLIVLNRPPVRAAFQRPPRSTVAAPVQRPPRSTVAAPVNRSLGLASLWLSIAGIVLPVCLAVVAVTFIERENQKAIAMALCWVLVVVLELAALGCGIAGRRAGTGKAGMVISGIVFLLLAYCLWEWFRRHALHTMERHEEQGRPAHRLAHEMPVGKGHPDAAALAVPYVALAALDATQSALPAGAPFHPPTDVAFSADGKSLIALVGMHVHRWQLDPQRDLGRRKIGDFIFNAKTGTLAMDGKTITLVRKGGEAELWAIDDGVRLALIKDAGAFLAAISQDGRRAAVAQLEGAANIIDAKTGVRPLSAPGASPIRALAFLAEGYRTALGRVDGSVEVYLPRAGPAQLAVPEGWDVRFFRHPARATCVALERNAAKVAAGFADGALLLWDVAKEQQLARLGPHPGVTSVAFSPDGERIATGSTDGTVKLWGPREGRGQK